MPPPAPARHSPAAAAGGGHASLPPPCLRTQGRRRLPCCPPSAGLISRDARVIPCAPQTPLASPPVPPLRRGVASPRGWGVACAGPLRALGCGAETPGVRGAPWGLARGAAAGLRAGLDGGRGDPRARGGHAGGAGRALAGAMGSRGRCWMGPWDREAGL